MGGNGFVKVEERGTPSRGLRRWWFSAGTGGVMGGQGGVGLYHLGCAGRPSYFCGIEEL